MQDIILHYNSYFQPQTISYYEIVAFHSECTFGTKILCGYLLNSLHRRKFSKCPICQPGSSTYLKIQSKIKIQCVYNRMLSMVTS